MQDMRTGWSVCAGLGALCSAPGSVARARMGVRGRGARAASSALPRLQRLQRVQRLLPMLRPRLQRLQRGQRLLPMLRWHAHGL